MAGPNGAKNLTSAELEEIDYAYHVTNQGYGKGAPTFNTLKWNFARDTVYDGNLVGCPVVFFSTTLRERDLPKWSSYPTTATYGEAYYRVRVPLKNFMEYDKIWKISTNTPKQHLLLLTKGDEECKLVQGNPGIEEIDFEHNNFLRRIDEEWYSNEYDETHYFVNFAVFGDFPLEDCEWDVVQKMNGTWGELETRRTFLTFCDDECSWDCFIHCNWRIFGAIAKPKDEEEVKRFCRDCPDRAALAKEVLRQWKQKKKMWSFHR